MDLLVPQKSRKNIKLNWKYSEVTTKLNSANTNREDLVESDSTESLRMRNPKGDIQGRQAERDFVGAPMESFGLATQMCPKEYYICGKTEKNFCHVEIVLYWQTRKCFCAIPTFSKTNWNGGFWTSGFCWLQNEWIYVFAWCVFWSIFEPAFLIESVCQIVQLNFLPSQFKEQLRSEWVGTLERLETFGQVWEQRWDCIM